MQRSKSWITKLINKFKSTNPNALFIISVNQLINFLEMLRQNQRKILTFSFRSQNAFKKFHLRSLFSSRATLVITFRQNTRNHFHRSAIGHALALMIVLTYFSRAWKTSSLITAFLMSKPNDVPARWRQWKKSNLITVISLHNTTVTLTAYHI